MTTPRSVYLFGSKRIPEKSRYPAIDAHNHFWGSADLKRMIAVFERTGIALYCDLTANLTIQFADGGFVPQPREINTFFETTKQMQDRFYCFTMAGFAVPQGVPLFEDIDAFATGCARTLEHHVELGAKGLKVLKELGLSHRDAEGNLIHIDDERLSPIWETAADLGVPVLMHQSDPYGFFEPVTQKNEHFESLAKFPAWSFVGDEYPDKQELLDRRDRLIARHRGTTFILPHVANFAENLPYVSRLLDENPNVYIDFSARLDELGRQPYTSRSLFMKYADRIIFGTDMPADIETSVEMYRTYIRFLETCDEGFYAPDYDGTFDRARWTICGIGLPDDVLRKIYYENILALIPSLGNAYQTHRSLL